jgi:hypothetical protein
LQAFMRKTIQPDSHLVNLALNNLPSRTRQGVEGS